MFGAIQRPDDMKPSRSPIHFTNEVEAAASPETIWVGKWDGAILIEGVGGRRAVADRSTPSP